ncbi:hypothetical protein OQA88_6183 [Cercophora sp. LCS_1]
MTGRTALVTGATGLLGRQVTKVFRNSDWDVKGTGFSRADGTSILKVDLSNADDVEKALEETKPNVIVHCAANRFPDKVDKDPEGTRILNIEASESLARLCAQRDILVIYISTDYVFAGRPGDAPYEADAETGPTNLYGQTKLDGEKAVLEEFKAAGKEGLGVVLRVPVLYGSVSENKESAVNVLMDIVTKSQQGGKVAMDHWALRFPTNTEDVARICRDVATKYLDAQDRATLPRVLQFSSEDRYTKYEICQLFAEIMGVPMDNIEPNTEGNDPGASVQRPYDCHLSTRALKEIGIDVSTQDFTGWWRRECRAFRSIPYNIGAVAPLPLAQRDLKLLNSRPVLCAAADDDTINGLKPKGRVGDDNHDDHNHPDHLTLPYALQQHKQPSLAAFPTEPDPAASRRPLGSFHGPRKQDQRRQLLLQELQDDKENEQEQAAHWTAEVARLEAETDRILAEQHKRELRRQRLELQLSAPLPPLPPSAPSFKEKLSLLAKGRRAQESNISLRSSASPSVSPSSSAGSSIDLRRIKSSEPGFMSRKFIEAGGRGPTDAPRGASNGADRRVTVRCKGLTLDLVVSVETAAVDILIACSDQAPQPINVSTSILVETYSRLGLERRIRRYERIRDVMNSWDSDSQNILLVSTDAANGDPELELAGVPHTDKPPAGFVLPIYHSHKHGKWSKRYVTLLENGQLVSSKKPEPAPSDKDVVSLCHLSDFDIYMPTESQKRKTLKPPKKHCFGIKSQQKMAVFLNNDNYIHYFSTEDNEVANDFRSRVQHWRSWYLVNRALQIHAKKKSVPKPEAGPLVRKIEKPPQILPDEPSPPKKTVGHVRVNGHKVKVSVDEAPYTIGEFKPLINLQRFDKPLDEFGSDWVPDSRKSAMPAAVATATGQPRESLELRRDLSARPRGSGEYKGDGPAHRASGDLKREPISKLEPSQPAFAENGLLGAAYDERKQVQREENRHARTQFTSSSASAFTPGPSLLNSRRTTSGNTNATNTSHPSLSSAEGSKAEPQGWFPSALEHSAKSRSNTGTRPETSSSSTTASNRQQQHFRHRVPAQPLVNLNPTFVEPPQWSRTGRGHGFRAPEGKPLVDFATGPAAVPGARQV